MRQVEVFALLGCYTEYIAI